MKQLKSKQIELGLKTIGSVHAHATIYSELASILVCMLQLCFYIECPMGFHGCSCCGCKSTIVYKISHSSVAYIVCLLQQETFGSIWLSAVEREKSLVLLLLLIYPTWLVSG